MIPKLTTREKNGRISIIFSNSLLFEVGDLNLRRYHISMVRFHQLTHRQRLTTNTIALLSRMSFIRSFYLFNVSGGVVDFFSRLFLRSLVFHAHRGTIRPTGLKVRTLKFLLCFDDFPWRTYMAKLD